MKNVHLMPTNQSTWLHKSILTGVLRKSSSCIDDMKQAQGMNIYITNDEEIKLGDWVTNGKKYAINCYIDWWVEELKSDKYIFPYKKIILTTSKYLIENGVQAIDDEFLEWFVKNPSCEEIKVEEFEPIYGHQNNSSSILYKIIIPKEEPKQETLEEAAEKYTNKYYSQEVYERDIEEAVIFGAKWQQEQQDKFAIGFAEWLIEKEREHPNRIIRGKKLLEIYKKEKGL